MTDRTLILGHRGLPREAPENSLSGFSAALACGADGVELDVTLLADGTPVVHHDADLQRCAHQSARLRTLNPAALAEVNIAANWPELPAEPLPRLDQVIALLNQHHSWLNLELKDHGLPPDEVARAALTCTARFHNPQQLVVSSFSLPLLQACRAHSASLQLGLLYTHLPDDWQQQAQQLAAFSIHPYWRELSSQQAAAVRAAGFGLYLWTVDQPADISHLQRYASAIISNQPRHFLVKKGKP